VKARKRFTENGTPRMELRNGEDGKNVRKIETHLPVTTAEKINKHIDTCIQYTVMGRDREKELIDMALRMGI